LWKAYIAPTEKSRAPQADRWLSQYFKTQPGYGKKDRRWYTQEFFDLIRYAACAVDATSSRTADQVWKTLANFSFAKLRSGVREKIQAQSGKNKFFGGNTLALGLPSEWSDLIKQSSFSEEKQVEFLQRINTRPPLYLRVNHEKYLNEIEKDFTAHEFTFQQINPTTSCTAYRVEGAMPVYQLNSIKQGWVEIQDLASQMLGAAVDAHPGMTVWDACAGGGGKSMQIAAQLKNRGVLYASDIREYKLQEIKERAKRAGFFNVRSFVYDAEKSFELPLEVKNKGGFHRIMVDAPCSASGTLRRNPDVRLRLNASDVADFAQLQLKILQDASRYLRPNGKLIYATCSIFREENEGVVEKFLKTSPDFQIEKAELFGSPDVDSDTMYYCVMQQR